MIRTIAVALSFAVLVCAAPSMAQQANPPAAQKAAPKAPAKSEAPKAAAKGSATVKPGDQFGEWTYQCDDQGKDVANGTPPSCYLTQARATTNERGEQSRVLLVNVSRIGVGAERQPILFVFLPFGAAVQQDVTLIVDGSNMGLKSRVDTCVLQGCRVPFLLQEDAMDLLRKGKTAMVSFAPVGGNNVRVEVPLAGFTAGMAAVK